MHNEIIEIDALAEMPASTSGAILICTLGGVGGIGMNWTLYGTEGGFILVDAGTTFAPRTVAGVAAVMPDPRILTTLGDRLKGLVVTHFHEDHVGAIHRLWPGYAKCPIFAPPFAARMLTGRFQEAGTQGQISLKTFDPGSSFRVGPFRIKTIPVAHSTPDCVALSIETKQTRVLHTGDWKIDAKPGVGSVTDLKALAELGVKGVDVMLCDSTNADREVPQTTEAAVRRAMESVFRRTKGMVFVSSFGSNVARMASVAHAAKATRRKVALAGRSLRSAADAAQALGLTKDVPAFLEDAAKFKGTDRRARVLMCTGTQGEDNAALAKLAADHGPGGDARLPRVLPGDVVVHSARIIPGNEDYIRPILDRLKELGAEVLTADSLVGGDPLHVTGHPCREDLRTIYAAVQPRFALPIHGSPSHLAAHAQLAESLGIPSLEPVPGGVYEVHNHQLSFIGRLAADLVAVMEDGEGSIVPWDGAAESPVLDAAARSRFEAHTEHQRDRTARRTSRTSRNDLQTSGRRGAKRDVGQGRSERAGSPREKMGRSRNSAVASTAKVERNDKPGAQRRQREPVTVAEAHVKETRAGRSSGLARKASIALDSKFIQQFGGYREMGI
ncbi:ribonuclease J [Bosea sp. SSUT16]|uniref:Ribonuclease J n=1 Tax=Bosea spartocytisi TaxID=2773451 RepID=A0A927I2H5_9HYPH|nr:ribonuclease J [Bosea spartocytisi]MBD3848846.1 ribonuclease J [Bosea spartocytisi]